MKSSDTIKPKTDNSYSFVPHLITHKRGTQVTLDDIFPHNKEHGPCGLFQFHPTILLFWVFPLQSQMCIHPR